LVKKLAGILKEKYQNESHTMIVEIISEYFIILQTTITKIIAQNAIIEEHKMEK